MRQKRKYLRFSLSDRFEHWVQMAAFTTLAITGLVQKFATSSISVAIVAALGGVENVRIIHRVAATTMMLGVVYHLGAVIYKLWVLRGRPVMLPTFQDVKNAWDLFLYNLGRKKEKPQQGRYTFDEKFEYWAFVWGAIVMGATGFILWNPIAASKVLPGEFIPAAKAAHGGEALLAVLAIIIWHFYNVHIKHLNKSMFTGYLDEEEMLEEHPLELADIKAGIASIPVSADELKKRKRIFFAIYSVIAVLMLGGIYFFVSFEETAIKTVPPAEQVVVYAPLPPTPLPTPLPTKTPDLSAGQSWEAGINELLNEKCGACHGAAAIGGLDLTSYQNAMAGGKSGPVIIPGDPENSHLIQIQVDGGHPGQLSEAELQIIKDWIAAGAPEQ